MKTIIQILALTVLSFNLYAQRQISENYPVSPNQKIVLELGIADDILIKTWDKNELKIETDISINDNKDNDLYEFDIFESDHRFNFEAELGKIHRMGISFEGINKNCLQVNINYRIWLPANNELELETISGNIEIRGHSANSEIKTVSGFIDTDVDNSKGCKLEAKTLTGTIYSDLDITVANTENEMAMQLLGGANVKQKIGNADNKLSLNTISGDVFIRKR